MDNAIEIKDLIKTYKKARGVDGISLTVKKGDFFGFIGPNGAGKSTTIRTALGLIKKNDGDIRVLGYDIDKDKVKILQNIGYMPSEAMFYSSFKVTDIIKMAAEAHHKDCSERAAMLCETLKVNLDKKVEELSLGNRKKISIVCAMQHEPELYILDEPTSGLDPLIQKEFFRLLTEENKKGATVFFSSHVLSEIQSHCNNAAIIKEGKIIACDTVANLTRTNARKVLIRGTDRAPELEGMKSLAQENNVVSFLYSGSTDKLLIELGKLHPDDVIIEEPSMEEIFMHFYEKKEGGDQ